MPLQVEAKPGFWDCTTVLCVTPCCIRLMMFREVKPSAGGHTAGSGARILSSWHPVSAPVSGSLVGQQISREMQLSSQKLVLDIWMGVGTGNRPQECSSRRLSLPRNRVERGPQKEEVDFAGRSEHAEVACPSPQQGTHLGVKGLGLARLCLVV